jgi:hypothetical protein
MLLENRVSLDLCGDQRRFVEKGKLMAAERKKKHVTFKDVDGDYDLTGPLEEVIERLHQYNEHAKEDGYENIMIECDAGYNNISCQLSGDRLETDAEQAKRLRTEEKKRKERKRIKAKKEARERKEYERLKKKYE